MVQSIDSALARRKGGGGSSPSPVSSRIPPHNLDAEKSLLGAMLLSRDAIAAAMETCSSEDFYKPAHAHVFDAVNVLYNQGEPADPVTVADELARAGLIDSVGGLAALVALQADTPATTNAARYARIVEEHALLRRLIAVAGEIAEMGYSIPDDVADTLDHAETLVFNVAERRVTDSLKGLPELLTASMDRLELLFDRGETITGVPTGYVDLDERLYGLQPSTLVIVGARPAVGKSAFALGMAAHAAVEARIPTLMFSLEMGCDELTNRLLVSEARVDAGRMRNGRLAEPDWPKISNAVARLGDAPLFIDDNPNTTVMEIRAKARRLKARNGGLGLIIVDYLQLMSGGSAENRQLEVSSISRGLKILARELEVPVVALSQLSRQLEARTDKRPNLADLRESGCLPESTRLLRADTGEEVTLGELVLSQEQPLVWSLDDSTLKMVPRRLLKTFPSGIKPVFRLRLRSGYEVEATANHRFRAVDGWKRLDELAVGDHLATPRVIPAPTAGRRVWSDEELVLLAHLLGDGSIGPAGVKYATADPANKAVVEETARRLFGIEVTGKKQANTWLLSLPAPMRLTHGVYHPVRNWLEPHGLWGSRTHDKFIPESVLGASDGQLALFLRHLWATDGSITLGRNGRGPNVRVYYATTSRRLADGVRRALLRLGIRSRVAPARKAGFRICWQVAITGAPDLKRFLEDVGCHGARGDRIPAALERLSAIQPNPNVDIIPGRVRAQAAGSEELAALADSDVYWDEVVEISAVGAQPTFDATVEDTHNFVADGIIAHNSLEQDADVVMFLYRDELYNPESADRGVAEVIVAKHRNGPTGKVQLSFLEQYTKFVNMARV
jgi:replicative DNA helicase